MGNLIILRLGHFMACTKAHVQQFIYGSRPQWLHLLCLGALLLLLQQKEVSLHFNMSEDPTVKKSNSNVPIAKAEIAAASFSGTEIIPEKVESVIQQAKTYLGNGFQSLGENLNDSQHKTPPTTVSTTTLAHTVSDNLSNTYSNMTYANNGNSVNISSTSSNTSKKDKHLAKRKKQEKYVSRFYAVAKSEMAKYGIPASITLAQGLIESNAGYSRLSTKNNNHFGMKCFSKRCAKGHCSNFTDDSHKDFFRVYNTVWESFRAHSILLTGKRYKRLFKLDTKDYKGWAKGLKKAGYATDPKYAEKLIHIIEELKLYRYD